MRFSTFQQDFHMIYFLTAISLFLIVITTCLSAEVLRLGKEIEDKHSKYRQHLAGCSLDLDHKGECEREPEEQLIKSKPLVISKVLPVIRQRKTAKKNRTAPRPQ